MKTNNKEIKLTKIIQNFGFHWFIMVKGWISRLDDYPKGVKELTIRRCGRLQMTVPKKINESFKKGRTSTTSCETGLDSVHDS